MQRICIFGGKGQLGKDLVRTLSGTHEVVALDVDTCDITDQSSVRDALDRHSPSTVINCAAMTDVPACETNDLAAFQINALGAKHVAMACEERSLRLVHISTDYVFDGLKRSPYVETDATQPLNVYGLTKLAGEHYVRQSCSRHYIVRSSGLYGIFECQGKKTNFVETMLRLAEKQTALRVVNDETLTPTFTLHLARQIRTLLTGDSFGTYHATNQGACSWYEFAVRIFDILGRNVEVVPVTSREFGSSVRRPPYSVLDNQALREKGLDIMPAWDQALRDYFLDKDNKLSI